MSSTSAMQAPIVWRFPKLLWPFAAAGGIGLLILFEHGLSELVRIWQEREEYSFGMLVPFIAAFLVWQRKDQLEQIDLRGSWLGFGVLLAGVALGLVGVLSTLDTIVQYGFLACLLGAGLALVGTAGARILLVPALTLCFMVPLPDYLLREISGLLQLWSSQLGVAMIRLAGVSVYLEGNVIDLGTLKLQVVEACSGLRYLLPLMTLGFIAATFYRAAFWKKAVLFLSTVPITLFMNSFRIGVIGITADVWGKSAAEGFLHDFEGWVIFMLCTAALIVEMWLLTRLTGDRRPFAEIFALELPAPAPAAALRRERRLPLPFKAAAATLLAVGLAWAVLPRPQSVPPAREDFADFPLRLGDFAGRPESIAPEILRVLRLDDYLQVNYFDSRFQGINFYVAYYASQREGNSAHSPRACLPGDGWEMQSFEPMAIDGITVSGVPLRVNRAVIQKGESRQLVYYWFQQRGRVVTGEYAVKLYILADLLTRQRSDGALVRLATPLRAGEDPAAGDRRLQEFLALVAPRLPRHVPD